MVTTTIFHSCYDDTFMPDVVGCTPSQSFHFCLIIIKKFFGNIEMSAQQWFHLRILPCRQDFAQSVSPSIIASNSNNGTLVHRIQLEFVKSTEMKTIICPI